MSKTPQAHSLPRLVPASIALVVAALACTLTLVLTTGTGTAHATFAQASSAVTITRNKPQADARPTARDSVTFESWNADSASLAALKAFSEGKIWGKEPL